MMSKKRILIVFVLVSVTLLLISQVFAQPGLTPVEELGQFLYFDENLSEPAGQSCARSMLWQRAV